MRIVDLHEGDPTEFALVGRLDTNTSPKFASFTNDLFAQGTKNIIIDMGRCEYVASAGLRAIMSLQKCASAAGSLVFRNLKPEVREIFEMTGFDKILTLE